MSGELLSIDLPELGNIEKISSERIKIIMMNLFGVPIRLIVTEDPKKDSEENNQEYDDWNTVVFGDDVVLFVGVYTQYVGHPGYTKPDIYEVTQRIFYVTPKANLRPEDFHPWGTTEYLVEAGG